MNTQKFRTEETASIRYLLSLPDISEGETGPFPMLCFLHGYDEGAPMKIEDALTRHGPLRPGNPPIVGCFVVVAPQLPLKGDIWNRYADTVAEIVRKVRKKHNGDPDRTYLTGFSFGGAGVFDLALRQPDFWAALWSVDPTRVSEPGQQVPVWLSFGAVARGAKEVFIRALNLKSKGDDPDDPENDRVYLDEGEDHVNSATRAYNDDRIYSWLLKKHLDRSENRKI